MESIYYAGIGSRSTPDNILELMSQIGKSLAKHGLILRSGGAEGADLAFEKGCDAIGGKKEIFIPWRHFNNSSSELYTIPDDAYAIAAEYHPKFYSLQPASKKLIARNSMQVLGPNLKSPSKFVVCYTSDGKDSGGTGQAIRIAKKHDIPVFNLFNTSSSEDLKSFVRQITEGK